MRWRSRFSSALSCSSLGLGLQLAALLPGAVQRLPDLLLRLLPGRAEELAVLFLQRLNAAQILLRRLVRRLKHAVEPQRRLRDGAGLLQVELPLGQRLIGLIQLAAQLLHLGGLVHQQLQQLHPPQLPQFLVCHSAFSPLSGVSFRCSSMPRSGASRVWTHCNFKRFHVGYTKKYFLIFLNLAGSLRCPAKTLNCLHSTGRPLFASLCP